MMNSKECLDKFKAHLGNGHLKIATVKALADTFAILFNELILMITLRRSAHDILCSYTDMELAWDGFIKSLESPYREIALCLTFKKMCEVAKPDFFVLMDELKAETNRNNLQNAKDGRRRF